MSDISLRYYLLNQSGKKEVVDFMDFLLSRQKKRRKLSLSVYKKKILNVSTWTKKDIEIFTQNCALFNQWKIQEW